MKKRRKVVVDSVGTEKVYPEGHKLYYKVVYRYVGDDEVDKDVQFIARRFGDTDELAAYMRFVSGMADAGVDVVVE